MAYSSSSNLAFRIAGGNVTPYLMKHVLIMVLGILLIIYLPVEPIPPAPRSVSCKLFASSTLKS